MPNLTKKYLILTTNGELIAKAGLEAWGGDNLRLRLLEGQKARVEREKIVQLISDEAGDLPLQCAIQDCEGERIMLQKMKTLNPELRRNLCIPVQFDSFLYPVTGSWRGRRTLRSIDLSCGGLAFYTDWDLAVGEIVEVVIPKTTYPLLVRLEILRNKELPQGQWFMAGKFVGLEREEENMIREAVFSIQLQNRKRKLNTR